IQKAIGHDSLNNVLGKYNRKTFGLQVGYKENDDYFYFNLFRAADDSGSLGNTVPGLAPLENAIGSLSFYKFIPKAKLRIKGELFIKGALGFRKNNLKNSRPSATTRLLGSFFLNYQSSLFGIDAQYLNYGMHSSPANDTLKVDNVTQSFSVSPKVFMKQFGA